MAPMIERARANKYVNQFQFHLIKFMTFIYEDSLTYLNILQAKDKCSEKNPNYFSHGLGPS